MITTTEPAAASIHGVGLTQYGANNRRFLLVKFIDGEPQVLVRGPNGGLLANVAEFTSAELEQFALDILQALHDKRGAS